MIRNADVLPSAVSGGLRHLFDRCAAVGIVRMAMQCAFDVFARDELGKRAAGGSFDFSEPFAQFRWNVIEAERLEEIALRCELHAAPLWTHKRGFLQRESASFCIARELNDVIGTSRC